MNHLVLLVLLLKILCNEKYFKIRKVYFLENNFCKCKNLIKTGKVYLKEVRLVFKEYNSFGFGDKYCLNNSFFLGHTKLKYFKIDNLNFDDKIYFSNASQVDKIFLRVHFVFEDLTSENNYRSLTDKKKFYWYESFKWPEKSSYNINSISLKCDEIKARKISINENLRRIVDKNFHKIDKCIQDFGRDKFLNQVKCDGNFDLFYFQKHLECLKTLQKFVKNFEYFKLVEDDFSGGTINMKTTMKISELKNFFKDKFKEDLGQESNNYDKLTSKTFKSFETLINDCFTSFVTYMLKQCRANGAPRI